LDDLNLRDRQLMQAVIGRFADLRPDLADASSLAIAKRLGIGEFATFDRRAFAVYRTGRNAALHLTDFAAPLIA
jgi:predicted nucleic acid-binding protein